jgi:hypothetical protein
LDITPIRLLVSQEWSLHEHQVGVYQPAGLLNETRRWACTEHGTSFPDADAVAGHLQTHHNPDAPLGGNGFHDGAQASEDVSVGIETPGESSTFGAGVIPEEQP